MTTRVRASEGVDPLYARIARTLREEIAAGRHAVGSLLPAEAELCRRFEVSRYTVREALRRLTEAGLVARRQGAGTLVLADAAPKVFAQSMRSVADLLQYAVDTKLVVSRSGLRRLSAEEAALVGGEPGTTWLEIVGTRRGASGGPICAVRVFVDARFAAVAEDLGALDGPIFARIEQRFGVAVAEVDQEIGAGAMPGPVARALGLEPKSVGMRFRRRYLDAGGAVVLTSLNWHPADRFVYAMRLKRGDDS
jgi:DNA-binding GntR family transcriptional regulator